MGILASPNTQHPEKTGPAVLYRKGATAQMPGGQTPGCVDHKARWKVGHSTTPGLDLPFQQKHASRAPPEASPVDFTGCCPSTDRIRGQGFVAKSPERCEFRLKGRQRELVASWLPLIKKLPEDGAAIQWQTSLFVGLTGSTSGGSRHGIDSGLA